MGQSIAVVSLLLLFVIFFFVMVFSWLEPPGRLIWSARLVSTFVVAMIAWAAISKTHESHTRDRLDCESRGGAYVAGNRVPSLCLKPDAVVR